MSLRLFLLRVALTESYVSASDGERDSERERERRSPQDEKLDAVERYAAIHNGANTSYIQRGGVTMAA